MPRGNDFTYTYEIGKPWGYNALYSSSKFGIYKSDSLLNHEKDSVARQVQPYFNMDTNVKNKATELLHETLAENWDDINSRRNVLFLTALLDTVYGHGILSNDDYATLMKDGNERVRLLIENNSLSVPASYVFSEKSAYEFIIKSRRMNMSGDDLKGYNVNEYLYVNLTLDENKTKTDLDNALSHISETRGFVEAHTKIIDRGEAVTNDTYEILRSFERNAKEHGGMSTETPFMLVGQFAFVLLMMLALVAYVTLFRPDYYDALGSSVLPFALTVLFTVLACLMESSKVLNVFMLPCCMVPIIIRVFMDSRTAFMFHCAMVLIISLIVDNAYEFVVYQIATGMVAIQTLRQLTQRSQIIRTSFLIFVIYAIVYTSYTILHENSFKTDADMYMYFAVNCVLLLFAYPALWMFEKVFGFVSDVTLVELSNLSNPLLRRMTEVAPGTFQHSMQVSNLCAEVANRIGAKELLVRTGALYHDIGKIEHSVFFTENQNGVSPHKHLTALKSAEVIISHVTNGLALADKHHLPESIKQFIRTHHGLGKAKYFFITYKNEHPDEEVDDRPFSYPGPNPVTKEEAILMMCDSVEAASRSLPEYTEESISNLVDKIVDGQMAEGFFVESSVTFRDIAIAKKVLKEKLKTIYHTRISYPELQGKN